MNSILKDIKENWFLVAFITSLILWYASVNARLSNVEASDIQQEVIIQKIGTMQIDIAVIKNQQLTDSASLQYIKEHLK